MNKAKKYYVDTNENMIGYTRHNRLDKIEKPTEMFHAKLKIAKVGWLNNGFYFVLEDENGKTYIMNDVLFREYIERMISSLKEIGIFINKGQRLALVCS